MGLLGNGEIARCVAVIRVGKYAEQPKLCGRCDEVRISVLESGRVDTTVTQEELLGTSRFII